MWMLFLFLGISMSLLGSGEHAGRRAPGFSLPDTTQRQHDLQDYRGKVVLIDFMRTNCLHCQAFSPILEKAKAKYGDRIVILSVALGPDNPSTVAKYIAENGVTVPVLLDCGQVAYSYIRPDPSHPAVEVPHLFIVGGDGIIRNDFIYGPDTKDLFEGGPALFTEIDRALAGGGKR
jgi:peroxiredoxin